MKLGTLTTGDTVETTIRLNFLPQWINYVAATALKGLRVIVQGDGVICDLDENGIKGVSGIRRYGAVANSYMIPLSDGLIPGKVVDLVFTNSAAQTPDIYGFSTSTGSHYVVSQRQTVLAASGITINNFAHLAIIANATTDRITIGFKDGTLQEFVSEELKNWYTLYSNETDSYCIDNIEGNIDYVRIIPAADRVIVWTKYAEAGEIM